MWNFLSAVMDSSKLDRIVADARRAALERGPNYRERALKIYPWICGREVRGEAACDAFAIRGPQGDDGREGAELNPACVTRCSRKTATR